MTIRAPGKIFGWLALSLLFSVSSAAVANAGGCDIANKLNVKSLVPPGIVGSGPFGETQSLKDAGERGNGLGSRQTRKPDNEKGQAE